MRPTTMTLFAGALLAWSASASWSNAATRQAEPPAPGMAYATFAGGCFWCMEPPFDKTEGVISTTSGYTGGAKAGASYDEVSAGGTGHTEAVRVVYDPSKVTYPKLLDVYWRNVDPVDATGQFCDKGEPYKPAIFASDEEQRKLADASKLHSSAQGASISRSPSRSNPRANSGSRKTTTRTTT
jgi:peptide-methionine (S)-S-oxide reductase